VSPRKSSTSSGRSPAQRPRYLGIEAAGEHLPALSPRTWEGLLGERLSRAGVTVRKFRLIRAEGSRAVVEVDHRAARRAREVWSEGPNGPGEVRFVPYRTWGTLDGAKRWLREARMDARA